MKPSRFRSPASSYSVLNSCFPHMFWLTGLRFEKPDDGLPVIADWCQTAESMLMGGIDLGREPIDGGMPKAGGTVWKKNIFFKKRSNMFQKKIEDTFQKPWAVSWKCSEQSVDVIKGWTRASAVALFLLAAAELDLSDSSTAEKLKPLFPVLDRAWMIPCHAPWVDFGFHHILFNAFCFVFWICLVCFWDTCSIPSCSSQGHLRSWHGFPKLPEFDIVVPWKWETKSELLAISIAVFTDHGGSSCRRPAPSWYFNWRPSQGGHRRVSFVSRAQCEASSWRRQAEIGLQHDCWHVQCCWVEEKSFWFCFEENYVVCFWFF